MPTLGGHANSTHTELEAGFTFSSHQLHVGMRQCELVFLVVQKCAACMLLLRAVCALVG